MKSVLCLEEEGVTFLLAVQSNASRRRNTQIVVLERQGVVMVTVKSKTELLRLLYTGILFIIMRKTKEGVYFHNKINYIINW